MEVSSEVLRGGLRVARNGRPNAGTFELQLRIEVVQNGRQKKQFELCNACCAILLSSKPQWRKQETTFHSDMGTEKCTILDDNLPPVCMGSLDWAVP